MRAQEFIVETEGDIPKHHAVASKGTHKIRDKGGYDRTYQLNRLMMAMACADGKDKKPIKGVDHASWNEKYNTAHPYTEQEHNMLHQALASIPSDHQTVVPFSKSSEVDDTNKISPVRGFKGYAR